jgi:hypothetical protein
MYKEKNMIFNTNWKDIMLSSFVSDLGAYNSSDEFINGALAIYSGDMPTSYSEFESDWQTKYFINGTTSFGTNVLAVFGNSSSSSTIYQVGLDRDNDGNFTLNVDYINDMVKTYVRDGVASFAAFYPWRGDHNHQPSSASPNQNNYFICTVSDGTGNGIVQLDNTTILGEVPILSSFGFSFSAGGE